MATRDTPFPPGTPCWVDLMSSDTARSRTFYSALLGWEFTEPNIEFGGYANASLEGHVVAGLMAKEAGVPFPDCWSTYVSTADAAATIAKVADAGGTVRFGPDDVADLGRLGMLLDPAGAAIGVWQPGTHTGFQRYNEPGTVCWNELHSKDFPASTAFCADVFGFTYEVVGDSDEFRYSTFSVDGGSESVGGVMDSSAFLPAEVPSHWAVYFCVADADAATARAADLGATVNRGPEDTPYGRMSDLLDPTGAGFKLIQLPG